MAFLFRPSFRSLSISTSLFAGSPTSPLRPITFGQLVSSDLLTPVTMESPFSRPSCPCCAFLSGGLFLPWNEGGDSNKKTAGEDGAGLTVSGASSLAKDVATPAEAWARISSMGVASTERAEKRKILLVDTHGHPHLQREVQYALDSDATSFGHDNTSHSLRDGVVSLTCAVSPLDWKDTLDYASQSPLILPALGVHPWYLADIMVDVDSTLNNDSDDDNVEQYIKWEWLADLETHLSKHPNLLVGEIGLCKMARFVREFPKEKGGKATALQLQKLVFRKQLELAAKWSRPVTVHCVNAHGIFMEVMKDILKEAKECTREEELQKAKPVWRKAFPPSIAMHSFTGTAHHVGEILDLEKEILHPEEILAAGKRRRKKQQQQKQAGNALGELISDESAESEKEILFYFGFSHAVNHLMCTSEKARKKGMEAVRSIPQNRLLIESDVHASVDVALGTAGAAAYAAQARGEMLEEVAQRSTRNGLGFLSSLGSLADD